MARPVETDEMRFTPPAEILPPSEGAPPAVFGDIITAQVCKVKRDENWVTMKIKEYAAANGGAYLYSWAVKDRNNSRSQMIEGPTIKLAMDLHRLWGNSALDMCVVSDAEAHTFYARFVDLETGMSVVRPFRQARSKNIGKGMRDQSRQDDIIYQIGASKATRNVIVNALGTWADLMVEESKKNLLGWVENNPDKADTYIKGVMEKFEILLPRIEAVVGRKRKDWTMPNLSMVMTQLRAIDEGMAIADETYPTDAEAQAITQKKEAVKADKAPVEEKVDQETGEVTEAAPAPTPEPVQEAPTEEEDELPAFD